MGFMSFLFKKKNNKAIEYTTIKTNPGNLLSKKIDLIKKPDFNYFEDEIIGQKDIIGTLKAAISVAHLNNKPLQHILFYGNAGFGKTLIAKTVAKVMSSNITMLSGPKITEKIFDEYIKNVEFGDIIFIDEIHSIKNNIEELFYEAMQDFTIDGVEIPRFTLIGATTNASSLKKPFKDRFRLEFKMSGYSDDELEEIIELESLKIRTKHSPMYTASAFKLLASYSRGTPRVAIKYFNVVELMAIKDEMQLVDEVSMKSILKNSCGVICNGLNKLDIEYLNTLYMLGPKPIGVRVISAALQEDYNDIVRSVEPYLLKLGYITITNAGRALTETGKAFQVMV